MCWHVCWLGCNSFFIRYLRFSQSFTAKFAHCHFQVEFVWIFKFSSFFEFYFLIFKSNKSNTYSAIEAQSTKIWKMQRYDLVYEFFHRPFFPPPFVLINYCLSGLKFVVRWLNEKKFKSKFLRKLTTQTRSGLGSTTCVKCIFSKKIKFNCFLK